MIYGPRNMQNPIIMHMVSGCLGDEACLHGILAFAGFRRHFLRAKVCRVEHISDERLLRDWSSEADFHLHEAVRLLNKKLEDPKNALTNMSILAAALLGTCAVRGPPLSFTLVKRRSCASSCCRRKR